MREQEIASLLWREVILEEKGEQYYLSINLLSHFSPPKNKAWFFFFLLAFSWGCTKRTSGYHGKASAWVSMTLLIKLLRSVKMVTSATYNVRFSDFLAVLDQPTVCKQ